MNNNKPLTPRQREVLEMLITTTEQGRQCTMREIGERFGYRSTNATGTQLRALHRAGFIVLGERMQRSVTILRLPSGEPYELPSVRLERLIDALGCVGFRDALAVARGRKVA